MKQLLLGLLILTFISCNSRNSERKNNDESLSNSLIDTSLKNREFGDRLFIIGDFNGDKIIDTIHESYISSLTKKETYKKLDATDWTKNQELVYNNKPETRIYSSIPSVDTFVVTTKYQQAGLSHFQNLGDINNDGLDEFGYVINWIDNSNINTYHILSLKEKEFNEIFSFNINEMLNFDPEQLFDNGELIKKVGEKTIMYKFYSDSASVETNEHKFE